MKKLNVNDIDIDDLRLFTCWVDCKVSNGSELRLMNALNLLSLLTPSFFLSGSSFLLQSMFWNTLYDINIHVNGSGSGSGSDCLTCSWRTKQP